MDSVEVKLNYESEDFVRALTFVNRRSWLYRYSALLITLSIFVPLFLFILSLRDPSDGTDPILLIPFALIPAVITAGIIWGLTKMLNPFFLRRVIKKQIASSPLLQEPNFVRFDSLGMHGSTYLGDSSMKWAAFVEATETESDLHFFTSPKVTIFVPKDAFANAEEIDKVKRFAEDALGGRAHFN